VTHLANASWWRFAKRLDVDDWASDPEWVARVSSRTRWLSTNHLMGRGYWVWLIPLGSGSTSVGIVVDANMHAYDRINRMERALDWLREFEPQCAEVCEAHMGDLEDFLALKHYAHGCERVYSTDRWLLTGEAGVFTDPFYSPGSDFIAIGNDIVAELIARDRRGDDITHHAAYFSRMYLLLFQAFHRLYDGQYPIMGNAQVMTVKVAWDNACYWALSALLYFRRKYRDMAYMQQMEGLLTRFFFLHARMQARLKQWSDTDQATYGYQQMSLLAMPYLRRLQDQLWDDLDDAALTARLHENFAELERYAAVVMQMIDGKTIDRHAGGFENAAVFQLPKVASLTMP
jgi:hypothetical protein